jgi:uncharacterized protein (TIGR02246 family)
MKLPCDWNRVLLLAAAMAAAGAGGFLAVKSTEPVQAAEPIKVTPSPHDPNAAEDEKAIQKNQAGYLRAFNSGDAMALAAFWAADGEFVDAAGKSFKGRSAIEKEFASYFAETKGLKLEVSTDSLRFVSPLVALESGTSRLTRPSDGESNVAAYHIVHAKRDGQWQLASVRESAQASSSNYEQLRSLEWLVGNWASKNGGRSLEISCEWAAKRNFLLRKYVIKGADDATKTGMQVIGWDPVEGTVVSWTFDSDGGFSTERWTKEGKRWILETAGVSHVGAEVTATYFLTPIDHDNFTWQSTHRTLDQVPLADTALVKISRVKASK